MSKLTHEAFQERYIRPALDQEPQRIPAQLAILEDYQQRRRAYLEARKVPRGRRRAAAAAAMVVNPQRTVPENVMQGGTDLGFQDDFLPSGFRPMQMPRTLSQGSLMSDITSTPDGSFGLDLDMYEGMDAYQPLEAQYEALSAKEKRQFEDLLTYMMWVTRKPLDEEHIDNLLKAFLDPVRRAKLLQEMSVHK